MARNASCCRIRSENQPDIRQGHYSRTTSTVLPARRWRSVPLSKAARPSVSGKVAAIVTCRAPQSTSSASPEFISIRCDDKKGCCGLIPRGQLGRRRYRQGHQPTSRAQQRVRALQCLSANRVEDDVVRGRTRIKRRAVYINDWLRTKSPGNKGIGVAADGGGDMCTGLCRQLHREPADPAGTSMHKDRVVRPEAGMIMETLPPGQAGQRKRCCKNMGHLRWTVSEIAGRKGNVFGGRAEPIEADQPENLVTDRQVCHPRPHPATTPDISCDGIIGRWVQLSGQLSSAKVMAAAWTSTRTSPGPGCGRGTATMRSGSDRPVVGDQRLHR